MLALQFTGSIGTVTSSKFAKVKVLTVPHGGQYGNVGDAVGVGVGVFVGVGDSVGVSVGVGVGVNVGVAVGVCVGTAVGDPPGPEHMVSLTSSIRQPAPDWPVSVAIRQRSPCR